MESYDRLKLPEPLLGNVPETASVSDNLILWKGVTRINRNRLWDPGSMISPEKFSDPIISNLTVSIWAKKITKLRRLFVPEKEGYLKRQKAQKLLSKSYSN